MTDMIMKEIKALGKENQVLDKDTFENIKNKVKDKIQNKQEGVKNENQSSGVRRSILPPEEKLSD